MEGLTQQTLKIFWQHATRYRRVIFLLLVSLVLATTAEVAEPLFYKKMFDTLAQNNVGLAGELIRIIWLVLLINFVSWIFWRLAEFTNNFFQPRVMNDLTNTCFKYLHDHSYGFFTNKFTGSLVRRVNRYAYSFETIADQLYWGFGQTFLRIIFILIILGMRHWLLVLIIVFWAIIYLALNIWFSKYKLKYDIQAANTDSKISAFLADTIINNINLKLFSGTKREYQNFKKITDKSFYQHKFSWNLGALSQSIQAGFMIMLNFGVLYLTVHFWKKGILTIGDFVLIQTYLLHIFMRLWSIGRDIRRVYESLAKANEMTEILLTPFEVQDIPQAKPLKVSQGKIEFKKVDFHYPKQQKIFRNLSLTVAPGERLALIGPSGGGKSTVTKLLFRFFDIKKGKILIDGANIAEVTQESLRQNISLVPQDPILFHRTLFDNIRYSRPQATKKEVLEAAKMSHAHEFIKKFPQGYKTYVGERGIKLSGGERQRVAIARAILKDSPILVLDEATSSLDSESEYFIQDALRNLMKNRTTIVIAHRLSTIMQMDRIIVLENGRITEEGRHNDLLKINKGTYQKLWEIQAGGFA